MHSDQTKVRQCLLNLLSNAAKFTRDGRVKLDVRMEGDRIRFQVSDTGTGIASEKLDSLFEPFTQLHEDQEASGSGLGLAITYRLSKLLGGAIEVDSEAGQGARFTLILPLQAPEAEVEAEKPELATAAGSSAAAATGVDW